MALRLCQGCCNKQQQQQPFYGPLYGTNRVSRYQKKHSPTHHPDHHPIFISFFHLPRSIASILRVQIMCLAVFLHNLSPRPCWSTSWSGALHLIFHTCLHPISCCNKHKWNLILGSLILRSHMLALGNFNRE